MPHWLSGSSSRPIRPAATPTTETYYVTRDFDQARTTFSKLVTDFPNSQKVADSRLKLGYIHYESKDWKAARTELETVTASWPASTAARLANERLARMKKEGH
jgi:TolA-binding protein